MALTTHGLSSYIADQWSDRISGMIYGIKTFGHRKKSDPFEVTTIRSGDYVIVRSDAYSKMIEMKDKFLWKFTGRTWEQEVREAQREAFEAVYIKVIGEERKDYQVNRLK